MEIGIGLAAAVVTIACGALAQYTTVAALQSALLLPSSTGARPLARA